MPHSIVTGTCEGVADCVSTCPVACIHPGPGTLKYVEGAAASAGVMTSTDPTNSPGQAAGRAGAAEITKSVGAAEVGESWKEPTGETGRASPPACSGKGAPPVHRENGIFQPSDFLSAEALGTDMPRRCKISGKNVTLHSPSSVEFSAP